MRALLGQEWDPLRWEGVAREGPDEVRDAEPPNSDESLPVQVIFPSPVIEPLSLQWFQPSHLQAEGIKSTMKTR